MQKKHALLRILKATLTLPAQVTFYAAALGAILLVPGVDLPPALSVIASGVGVNALSSILERIAKGEQVSDSDIRNQVQASIDESQIGERLSSRNTQAMIARLFRQYDVLKFTIQSSEHDILQRLTEQAAQYEGLVAELRDDISVIQYEVRQLATHEQGEEIIELQKLQSQEIAKIETLLVQRLPTDIRRTYRHLIPPGDVLAELLDKIEKYGLRPPTEPGATIPITQKILVEPLLKRHTLFGGRDAELKRLNDFLAKRPSGYQFVTGPSGYGKTALLANWVKALQHDDHPVVYHFISRVDNLADERSTLLNLCEQLAAYHGLRGISPESIERLRSLLRHLLRFPLDKDDQLVVLLDGLDEAVGWQPGPGLFPHPLPEGLFIVFSARKMVERDWLAELELPRNQVDVIELSTLGVPEIARLLQAAGDGAARWAEDADFLAAMAGRSAGDPFYLHYLIEDIRDIPITSLEEMEEQPRGLEGYLDKWWQEVSQATSEEAVRDLLGYLVVVHGPLTRADLCGISQDDALDAWSVDRTIERVKRYVSGNEEEGYRLSEPRFQEYLSQHRVKGAAREVYRERLLRYCSRWRDHKSQYALRHYTRHLKDAGRLDDLYQLISKDWMVAKLIAFHSHQPFSEDVALLIEVAGQEWPTNWVQLIRNCLIYATLGSLATNIPPEVIGMLAFTGQTAKALGYAHLIQDVEQRNFACASIVSALAERGKHLLKQGAVEKARDVIGDALAAMHVIEDDWAKAQVLDEVVQVLARVEMLEGVRWARAVADALGDERSKAVALGGIAQALAQSSMMDEAASAASTALETAGAIHDELDKATALSNVAQALALFGPGMMYELGCALITASTIRDEFARAVALSGVTLALALADMRKELDKAWAMVDAMQAGWTKAYALGGVAQALALVGMRDEAASVASAAVATTDADEYEGIKARLQSRAALALAWAGRMEKAASVADTALAMAGRVQDEQARVKVLSEVAEHLAQAGLAKELDKALDAAGAIQDEDCRAEALGGVAQALELAGMTQGLKQALAVASAIQDEFARAEAQRRVAWVLASAEMGDELDQALAEGAIQDKWPRATALAGVAECLAIAGRMDEATSAANAALATVGDIQDEGAKAWSLGRVAQALARAGRKDAAAAVATAALGAVETIHDQEAKLGALAQVAQGLAQAEMKEELEKVLAAAIDIQDEEAKVGALGGVAKALAKAEMREGLERVLAEASAIQDEFNRAWALSEVAHALAQAGMRKGLFQAWVAVDAIPDEFYREWALGEVAQALAQAEMAEQARAAVDAIKAGWAKAQALSKIAKGLAQAGKIDEATSAASAALAAGATEDEEFLVWSACWAAQTSIQAGRMNEATKAATTALAAVGVVRDELSKAKALGEVAQALAQVGMKEGLEEVLTMACAMQDEEIKARALGEMAQALVQAGRTGQALATAQALKGEGSRAFVLGAITRALSQLTPRQEACRFLLEIFTTVHLSGRFSLYYVLGEATNLLAAIDGGQTLWRVYQAMMEVESWWMNETD
jgi:hypothetical protein